MARRRRYRAAPHESQTSASTQSLWTDPSRMRTVFPPVSGVFDPSGDSYGQTKRKDYEDNPDNPFLAGPDGMESIRFPA